MPVPIGAAQPATCPACGVGELTGLCTLTRGEVESVVCDACLFYVRDGVVLRRGVDLDPADVLALGRAQAPFAPDDEVCVAPEGRPVRLLANWPGHPAAGAPAWPVMTSLTVRFARPRVPR
jgi:hypothetical protein